MTGPMVYGASWVPLSSYKSFCKLGFKDSKQLTAEKRENLFESLTSSTQVQINWKVTVISATEISEKMQQMYFLFHYQFIN